MIKKLISVRSNYKIWSMHNYYWDSKALPQRITFVKAHRRRSLLDLLALLHICINYLWRSHCSFPKLRKLSVHHSIGSACLDGCKMKSSYPSFSPQYLNFEQHLKCLANLLLFLEELTQQQLCWLRASAASKDFLPWSCQIGSLLSFWFYFKVCCGACWLITFAIAFQW